MSYKVGKGKPPKKYQFRKGRSGNPEGARKHDQVKKAIKKLTSEELKEVINGLIMGTSADLESDIKSKESPVLVKLVGNALLKASQSGDIKTLEALMDRVIGKVPTKLEQIGNAPKSNVVLYIPANGKTREENEGRACLSQECL